MARTAGGARARRRGTAAARWRERLAEGNADPAGAAELAALVEDSITCATPRSSPAIADLRGGLIDRLVASNPACDEAGDDGRRTAAAGWPPWWAGLVLAVAGLALAPLPVRASRVERWRRGRRGGATALGEGNRLFRSGRLAEAMTAYAAGWPPGGTDGGATGARAVLAYNLGTTAHRLGRYPEAVLWYRRAAAARLDDPWLRDNLELARARTGGEVLPPPGVLGWLAARCSLIADPGCGPRLDGARPVRRRPPRPQPPGLAGDSRRRPRRLAGAAALGGWGPRPAVLLERCAGPAGALAAGTEAWAGRPVAGARPVLGGPVGLTCPERALGVVE